MEELINLFHAVASFEASCNMNPTQRELYERLNKAYQTATKTNFNYSVCRKRLLLRKTEALLKENGYTFD